MLTVCCSLNEEAPLGRLRQVNVYIVRAVMADDVAPLGGDAIVLHVSWSLPVTEHERTLETFQ